MTRDEHIAFWKNDADRNWDTALYNLKGKQNVMALFLFHLTIEKIAQSSLGER